ncbi:MAG: flagellar basal-body rod protein FlgF [Bdellovibrionaceae bacterium]|nr:flagellar basal-body rod protein FlgF [Pseudobdellovibrionaceae bacterium]
MSTKGIYTALSGAMAQANRLDTIANNLANVNTAGFKKDNQTFYEYLTAREKTPDVIQVPRIPASIESFYDVQGGDRGYVDASGTYTDFSQGTLKATGNPLDLALEGEGFFEVLTPQGVRFTRDGSFKIDPQGRLVTKHGFPVLSQGANQPPEQRLIQVGNGNVTVAYNGDFYVSGEQAAKLSVVQPDNLDALAKAGAGLYSLKDNFETTLVDQQARVHQGQLEASNINVVQEMTDMISANRVFESTQKAIKAFDEMNRKLINEVPKTS